MREPSARDRWIARHVFLEEFFAEKPKAFPELRKHASQIAERRQGYEQEIDEWFAFHEWLPYAVGDGDDLHGDADELGVVWKAGLWPLSWISMAAKALHANQLLTEHELLSHTLQLFTAETPAALRPAPTESEKAYLTRAREHYRLCQEGSHPATLGASVTVRRDARWLVLYLAGKKHKDIAGTGSVETVRKNVSKFATLISLSLPDRRGRPENR